MNDNVTPLVLPTTATTSKPPAAHANKARHVKMPTTSLVFTNDERDVDPESLLIALRYQFAAIEHILSSNPGEFECMASYMATAGVAAARSLEERIKKS